MLGSFRAAVAKARRDRSLSLASLLSEGKEQRCQERMALPAVFRRVARNI
jgi:hypothetical protein